MSRTRSLKPGFFKNEALASLSPLTRLLFAGLWTLADRDGRLEERPARIKAEILPYERRLSVPNVVRMLLDLQKAEFISRYRVGSAHYIAIPAFPRHQHPHQKEPISSLPAPDSPGAEPNLSGPSTGQAGPISLILLPITEASASGSVDPTADVRPSGDGLAGTESPDQEFLRSIGWKGLGSLTTEQAKAIMALREDQTAPSEKLDSLRWIWSRLWWFDEFYQAYWRREDRFEAMRKYLSLVKTLDTHDKIIAAVQAQSPAMLARPKEKRALPATWLNKRRWEDQDQAGLYGEVAGD